MELHESVAKTAVEFTVKETAGFRVRVEKHEVISPKGLYSLDFIQESLKEDGTVQDSQTYNFFMTQEEIQRLAHGIQIVNEQA